MTLRGAALSDRWDATMDVWLGSFKHEVEDLHGA